MGNWGNPSWGASFGWLLLFSVVACFGAELCFCGLAWAGMFAYIALFLIVL
jgi:hypothetical protein